MRHLIIAAALALAACGSSPTAPTPAPATSTPPATTAPAARLIVVGTFVVDRCTGGMCVFQAEGLNTGDGCASAVHGTATLKKDGAPLVDLVWELEAARVVRPGERFTYAGPLAETHGDAATGYATVFEWRPVAC
jgi:hypothetical protein